MNTDLVEIRLNSINLLFHIHTGWAKRHLGRAKPQPRPSCGPERKTLSTPADMFVLQASENLSDTIIQCQGDEHR